LLFPGFPAFFPPTMRNGGLLGLLLIMIITKVYLLQNLFK